jgi:hypothetical protein
LAKPLLGGVIGAALVLAPWHGCNLPTPQPVPPIPTPTPPAPPTPADPLTATLQAAYASETDAKRADKLAALADYYGAVIAAARLDLSVTTVAKLQAKIHAGADVVTGAGGMPALRAAVAAYVAPKMPATDQPMTEALWLDATTAYADISRALKGVK